MKSLSAAVVVLTFFLLSGCKKNATEQTPVKKPLLLTVDATLYDEGDQMITDRSGMTISVENSDPLISAVTGSSGEVELNMDKAPLGMLALVFTKPGYGTHKHYIYKMEDGIHGLNGVSVSDHKIDATGTILGKKSSVTVNNLQASVVNNKLVLQLNISSPSSSGEKFVRFFYSATPGITFDNAIKDGKHMSGVVPVTNGTQTMEFCMSCLYQCTDFKKGDVVYLTAYGDSKVSNGYTEFSTMKMVLPNVNTSNHPAAVSFVMP